MSSIHLADIHPIIRRFPELAPAAIDALTADIKKNGLRRPVALYDGQIWDGRARVEACWRLRIQPKYWILRREDPTLFLIERETHNRYGAPRSPERDAALDILRDVRSRDGRAHAKKQKADWIKEARREFRAIASRPEPCAVCKSHIQFVHAHHSLPLNIQYGLGLTLADHTHDWLCPVHHRIVHVFVSIYITGARDGEILDNIHPTVEPEWAVAERVFTKGIDLFRAYGGQTYSWARWHDRYT